MILTFFELHKITDEVFDVWLKKLPKFRQDKVMRYRFRNDRVRSLCAYLLLCVGLGRIVENFSYNEHGKPALLDGDLQINFSHAKSAVVAGFSKHPIGVDVEFIREKYPKIVCKRVFTDAEIQQIETAKDPTLMFFKFWTLKESFVKCLGQGLSFPLKTVEFQLSGEEVKFAIGDAGADLQSVPYTFSTFTQDGHQVSICVGTDETSAPAVRNLSFEEFSNLITVIANCEAVKQSNGLLRHYVPRNDDTK